MATFQLSFVTFFLQFGMTKIRKQGKACFGGFLRIELNILFWGNPGAIGAIVPYPGSLYSLPPNITYNRLKQDPHDLHLEKF